MSYLLGPIEISQLDSGSNIIKYIATGSGGAPLVLFQKQYSTGSAGYGSVILTQNINDINTPSSAASSYATAIFNFYGAADGTYTVTINTDNIGGLINLNISFSENTLLSIVANGTNLTNLVMQLHILDITP